MVWANFSAAGKTKLHVLHGKQNSDDYVYTVSEFMLPYAHQHYGTDGLHLPAGRRFDPPLQAHARVLRGARGSGAAVAGTLARPQSDRKSLVDHEPLRVR